MPQQPAINQNNARQPVIFLDIDGVLGDYETHARQEKKLKPDGTVDKTLLDYTWWATMPAFTGAKAFYDAAGKLGTTKFLTGPDASEDCFAGKAHWVMNFVPERGKSILDDLIICHSTEKFYLAQPNRILVDDRVENIKAWEAAGGIGILHTGNFNETLKKVQEAVRKLAIAPQPPQMQAFKCHHSKFHH